jgi:hypothetical protein
VVPTDRACGLPQARSLAASGRKTRGVIGAGQSIPPDRGPDIRQSRVPRRRRRPVATTGSAWRPAFQRQQGARASSLVWPHLREDTDAIGRPELPPVSPPAGLATASARTSSSWSARTPCFSSGAGTRTRRRGPRSGPALTPRRRLSRGIARDAHLASRGCDAGSADRRQADPCRGSLYRLIRRPALAEIVGDGRPCTVLMISLLSMPWR